MKILISLIYLMSTLFLFGCGVETQKRETWYDTDKTILKELYYVSKEPPYRKYGEYKHYSQDGKLIEELNYNDGELDGKCISYFETGGKSIEATYDKGKISGEYKDYWENGNLMNYKNYDKNLLEGECKEYFKGGQVSKITNYSNNIENGYFASYNSETFTKDVEGTYKNHIVDGVIKYYYYNGNISMELTMNMGKKNGLYKKYSEDGKQIEEATFKNDLKEGVFKKWYPNEKIASEENYVGDVLNGSSRFYYPIGQLAIDKNYINGIIEGEQTLFSISGKIKIVNQYSDNKFIKNVSLVFSDKNLNSSQIQATENGIVIDSLFLGEGTIEHSLFKRPVASDPVRISTTIYRRFNLTGEDDYNLNLFIKAPYPLFQPSDSLIIVDKKGIKHNLNSYSKDIAPSIKTQLLQNKLYEKYANENSKINCDDRGGLLDWFNQIQNSGIDYILCYSKAGTNTFSKPFPVEIKINERESKLLIENIRAFIN